MSRHVAHALGTLSMSAGWVLVALAWTGNA